MATITIIKLDHRGREVFRYDSELLWRTTTEICVEAIFERGTVDFGVVQFEQGDRFVEWFYTDRWYNVFQVHKGQGPAIKGWYCNLTRPAQIDGNTVWAEDIALDVWVSPDGVITLLDEDEYAELTLSTIERQAVDGAVGVLRQMVQQRKPPFDSIG